MYSEGNINYHLIVNSYHKKTYPSYCNKQADSRGPHQNVISYSLNGNFSDPKHFNQHHSSLSRWSTIF